MKYLRRFNENKISIFDGEWQKFIPLELILVTNNGNFTLKRQDGLNNFGHTPGVFNFMNGVYIQYGQNTPENEGGDVLRDGEPDLLQFDISFVKTNNGMSSNPDSLKINVDITYGDAMACEFTIEKPNKVTVIHYTGIGSKYDPETFFGFEDESLKNLVEFLNRFGYSLTTKDFTFIDKYPDSYVPTTESIKLSPSFKDEYIMVINNSKPQENRYLGNVLKYLDNRGTKYKIVSSPEDVEKINSEFKIIGAISTGSEYRITGDGSDYKTSDKALSILTCPIVAMCYGMQAMCKYYGSELVSGDYKHGSYVLDNYENNTIFGGASMDNMKLSFSFNDYPKNCPSGFKVIGNIDDKIAAVSNDSKKQYGFLFHPEDIESTWVILDNFIQMCNGGKDDSAELKGEQPNQMQYLKKFENFRRNIW